MFVCPICREELHKEGKSYFCPAHHCYDIAKEGYVNLLPVQKKHAPDPGDTKEMVEARRLFLESGFYAPFRDKAKELVARYTTPGAVLLDAGCGEGYYTRAMAEGREGYGFDISRSAVKLAAKSDKNTLYAVAGSYSIPFPDEGADMLTAIFSPLAIEEFHRVIKKGGHLMIAVPTEKHLFGLKSLIYDDPYENEHLTTVYEGFQEVARERVEGEIELNDNALIRALFAMTPYYWKSSKESSQKANEAAHLRTAIGFDFIVYERLS